MPLRWYGAGADLYVRRKSAVIVVKATDEIHRLLRKKVGKSGSGSSDPGDYPQKVTGDFQRTIVKEVDIKRLEGRVGTNDPLGRSLEFGTSRMAPRPWLTKIISEMKTKLKAVVLSKGTG